MSNTLPSVDRIFRLIALAAIGALVGAIFNNCGNPVALHRTIQLPAPYRTPKIPGGTALRMAMVHDVLHERYLRHGSAWYAKRNEQAQKIIKADQAIAPPSARLLDAMDDLAVGQERLGQFEPAIALMRKKVGLLPPLPATTTVIAETIDDAEAVDLEKILASQHLSPTRHHQYTACANLGTILLIHSMGKALAGDRPAIAAMRESLQWVQRAIDINPGGHFGRERWQAILIEDLLAAIDHPEMLAKYDCFGQALGESETDAPFIGRINGRVYARRGEPPADDSQLTVDDRLQVRRWIPRIDSDKSWSELVHPDYAVSMPFDEPTLAIIGMWTMGSGPNPHFALALGRIMENVAQNNIAWNAYQRAIELQESFWPDACVRSAMVQYCTSRQTSIAKRESPENLDGWQATMRQQHQDELAFGIGYQKAYQDYEAQQIAAGVSLDAPNFYAAFFKTHAPIASNPGQVDDLIVTHTQPRSFADYVPMMVLGIGLGTLASVVVPDKHFSFRRAKPG